MSVVVLRQHSNVMKQKPEDLMGLLELPGNVELYKNKKSGTKRAPKKRGSIGWLRDEGGYAISYYWSNDSRSWRITRDQKFPDGLEARLHDRLMDKLGYELPDHSSPPRHSRMRNNRKVVN